MEILRSRLVPSAYSYSSSLGRTRSGCDAAAVAIRRSRPHVNFVSGSLHCHRDLSLHRSLHLRSSFTVKSSASAVVPSSSRKKMQLVQASAGSNGIPSTKTPAGCCWTFSSSIIKFISSCIL